MVDKYDPEMLKAIKRAAREKQLEDQKQFGLLRSKTWGGKASHKETRRKEKNRLKKIVDTGDLSMGDE